MAGSGAGILFSVLHVGVILPPLKSILNSVLVTSFNVSALFFAIYKLLHLVIPFWILMVIHTVIIALFSLTGIFIQPNSVFKLSEEELTYNNLNAGVYVKPEESTPETTGITSTVQEKLPVVHSEPLWKQLWTIVKTWKYIGVLIFTALNLLVVNFYVSNLNSQLRRMGDTNCKARI